MGDVRIIGTGTVRNFITEENWSRIIALREDGVTIPNLAIRFGVSDETIRQGLQKRDRKTMLIMANLKRKTECGNSGSPNSRTRSARR
jgi:hypothetical protein